MTLPILNINSTEHRYYIELIDIHNNECTDIIQLADSDETIYLFFRFLDMLLDKNRQLHPTDKKTDWFYRNKKYDMQKDEREDKNNYRTL